MNNMNEIINSFQIERNEEGMFRAISFLLILVGLGLLGYGGYELYTSKQNEAKSLGEAKEFISTEVIDWKEEIDFDYSIFGKGDTIGSLYIPRLDREIAIVEGTNEDDLKHGVGHYTGTGFPGDNKQILLSGHRDTVFRNFGELKDGDEFHVQMEHGTFIYVINDQETQIVPADDTTVIDPTLDDEVLTVSTCYPFSFIGSAPDRYVLHAYPKIN